MDEKHEIEGRWWPNGSPNDALYGVLHRDPDEGIQLITKDVRPRAPVAVLDAGESLKKGYDVVFGRNQHNMPITLFSCHPGGFNTSAAFQRSEYNVGCAFIGREFDSWDAVEFDTINIDFGHFHTWLNLPAFKDRKLEDGVSYVGYKHPEDIVYRVDEDTEIRISALSTSSSDKAIDETVLRLGEKRFIVVQWKHPVGMDVVRRWVLLLRRFLTLALGVPVDLRSLTGERPDHVVPIGEGNPFRKEVEIHGRFGSPLHREYRHTALIAFDEVKDSLGDLIKRWVTYGEKLGDVLDLYFSVIFNPDLYSNHRFLFLAQALERYHAVQFGGYREPPDVQRANAARASRHGESGHFLPCRQAKMVKQKTLSKADRLLEKRKDILGNIYRMRRASDVVRDTRNYYTHFRLS